MSCFSVGSQNLKLNPIQGPVLSTNGPLFLQGVHREGKANGEECEEADRMGVPLVKV